MSSFSIHLFIFLALPTLLLAGITPCRSGYGLDDSFKCVPCEPGYYAYGANYEPCSACGEALASSRFGASGCETCYGNNTVPNENHTRCVSKTDAGGIRSALIGSYENLLYSGAEKNDWHYVEITAKSDSQTELIWSNRAGKKWTLKLKPTNDGYDRTTFLVESDSPYYSQGHTDGEIKWEEETVWNIGNTVLGITGPWGELYTRV